MCPDTRVQLVFRGLSTFGSGRRRARNVEEVGGGNECRSCKSNFGECFVAGTKVQTPEGEKNIEDIKAGDKVYALNPTQGEGHCTDQPAAACRRELGDEPLRVRWQRERALADGWRGGSQRH